MKWIFILGTSLCLLVAGCKPASVANGTGVLTNSPLVFVDDGAPTHAQGTLRTMKLLMGNEEMMAELALNANEIRTGMMFRTNMDENAGMLFVFSQPHQASFWMKNCPMPLSAAYIDPMGKILEIRELEPFNTNSVVAKTDRVQFVLETKRGYFERKKISPGMMIQTERGTLQETFFSR